MLSEQSLSEVVVPPAVVPRLCLHSAVYQLQCDLGLTNLSVPLYLLNADTHSSHTLELPARLKALELATGIYPFPSKYAHVFGQKQYNLDQMNCNPKTCSEAHVMP